MTLIVHYKHCDDSVFACVCVCWGLGLGSVCYGTCAEQVCFPSLSCLTFSIVRTGNPQTLIARPMVHTNSGCSFTTAFVRHCALEGFSYNKKRVWVIRWWFQCIKCRTSSVHFIYIRNFILTVTEWLICQVNILNMTVKILSSLRYDVMPTTKPVLHVADIQNGWFCYLWHFLIDVKGNKISRRGSSLKHRIRWRSHLVHVDFWWLSSSLYLTWVCSCSEALICLYSLPFHHHHGI